MVRGMKKQIIRIEGKTLDQYVYLNHNGKSYVNIAGKFKEVKFEQFGRFWKGNIKWNTTQGRS